MVGIMGLVVMMGGSIKLVGVAATAELMAGKCDQMFVNLNQEHDMVASPKPTIFTAVNSSMSVCQTVCLPAGQGVQDLLPYALFNMCHKYYSKGESLFVK